MASKTTRTGPIVAVEGDLADLTRSWLRALRAGNYSPRTIQTYGESLRLLDEYLAGSGMPRFVAAITREHVGAWVEDLLAHHKASTARIRFAAARRFFGWCVDEGEVRESPMARMRQPKVPERMTDIPSDADLERLLASMKGQKFADRRDTALVRMFMSTGARLAEVAGLRFDERDQDHSDIDLDQNVVYLIGKGDRQRAAYLDRDAVQALDRYLRARRSHPHADSNWLWLGKKGRMTVSGIGATVRKRAAAVGFSMHAHQLRHYRADRHLAEGMNDGHVMALMGWRDPQMLRRYGSANETKRALVAAERLDRQRSH